MVWLPAVAVDVAERSASVFVSELEPCLPERTPTGSVSALMSLERVESRLPRLEITVSWDCRAVSWVLYGVSVACNCATIWLTVLLTSMPCPLVGEPKLRPMVPMLRSRRRCKKTKKSAGGLPKMSVFLSLRESGKLLVVAFPDWKDRTSIFRKTLQPPAKQG